MKLFKYAAYILVLLNLNVSSFAQEVTSTTHVQSKLWSELRKLSVNELNLKLDELVKTSSKVIYEDENEIHYGIIDPQKGEQIKTIRKAKVGKVFVPIQGIGADNGGYTVYSENVKLRELTFSNKVKCGGTCGNSYTGYGCCQSISGPQFTYCDCDSLDFDDNHPNTLCD